MQSMIHIGANEKTIVASTRAILSIINSSNNDSVKIAGLEALTKTCAVTNTSVMNCTFNAGKVK